MVIILLICVNKNYFCVFQICRQSNQNSKLSIKCLRCFISYRNYGYLKKFSIFFLSVFAITPIISQCANFKLTTNTGSHILRISVTDNRLNKHKKTGHIKLSRFLTYNINSINLSNLQKSHNFSRLRNSKEKWKIVYCMEKNIYSGAQARSQYFLPGLYIKRMGNKQVKITFCAERRFHMVMQFEISLLK